VTSEHIQVDLSLLLSEWNEGVSAIPHRQIGNLLATLLPDAALEQDTLGQRNRRLLQLHTALFNRTIEARVACPDCGTQNEFAVPREAMLAAKIADADAIVELPVEGGTARFRQPRLADIAASANDNDPKASLVGRCCLEGATGLAATEADELAARYDALDPLANIVIETPCAQCKAAISATVELADFVASDIGRLVDGLLRDVDMIASAYSWNEAEILALPPDRRARYVGMIAARRQPTRPQLAGLSA
jgi:hypothetical protein